VSAGAGAPGSNCLGQASNAGRRTVNTEPSPGSLITVTSPPIMRASLRVIARPRPVPPKRCAVVFIGLAELLKQLRLLLRRHTNARIGDRQLDPFAAIGHPARAT
jgi:hypothetical protein